MTQPRSATRMAFHLTELTTVLATAAGQLAAAREADPDTSRDAEYRELLACIGLVSHRARRLANTTATEREDTAA